MSQNRYPRSAKKGHAAETVFDTAAMIYGWIKIRDATRDENRLWHIDSLWYEDGEEIKVEVKSSKRFSRYSNIQFDYILLELHGVDLEKNEGWIFGSKADYIAFELRKHFVCFKLDVIKEFVKEKFGITSAFDPAIREKSILSPTYKLSPHYQNLQPYQIYHRLNNDKEHNLDAFCWIPTEDLLKLDHFMMKR